MIELITSFILIFLTAFICSIPSDDFSLKGFLSHKRQIIAQILILIVVAVLTHNDGKFDYYIPLAILYFWVLHATTSCGGVSTLLSKPDGLRAPNFREKSILEKSKELLRHWIIGLVWIHKKSHEKVMEEKEYTETDNPRTTLTYISNMARNIGAYIVLLGLIGLVAKTLGEDRKFFIKQYYYSGFLIYILFIFWMIFHRSFVNLISFEIEESMKKIEFSGERNLDDEHKSISALSWLISSFSSIAVIMVIISFPGI